MRTPPGFMPPGLIHSRRRQIGFTLIEGLVVIAIVAILAALAVPSFNTTMDKQRIVEAAEAVLSDLRWARSEAIARNRPVSIAFTTGTSWSYSVNTDPEKAVDGSDYPATVLSSAEFKDEAGNSVSYTTFYPARNGSPNKGEVTITSTYHSAKISVSALGRTRICGTMTGYHACS